MRTRWTVVKVQVEVSDRLNQNSTQVIKPTTMDKAGASGAYGSGARGGAAAMRGMGGGSSSGKQVIAAGPVEEIEIEEEVMVDGKLTKVKKTVYRQKKKIQVVNANGQVVEVEEYEDIDEEDIVRGDDGKPMKVNDGVKVNAQGKKMIKIVKKDKEGNDVVQWQELPDDVDFDDGEAGSGEQVVMADGKVFKKVVKKDKNGKEVVQWMDAEEIEKENEVVEVASGGMIKKTRGGKTLAKVVTKDVDGNEVEEWVEVPEGIDMAVDGKGPTKITAANGKILQKVIVKNEAGEDVVQWEETPESIAISNAQGPGTAQKGKKGAGHKGQGQGQNQNHDGDSRDGLNSPQSASNPNSPMRTTAKGKMKKGAGAKDAANGMMTLQEEVEEEVTIIDENGNAKKVIKKVMKTKHVKKVIDEDGEEVIEEEVIDPDTGVKSVVRRKVKELKNAKLTAAPAVEDDFSEGESVYSAGGTRVKNLKHREVQTSFSLEDMIKAALEQAGVKGSALAEINKALNKAGIDILKPKQEEDQEEYVTVPGQGKKKIVYKQGEDVEEVEYVTKDGKVIKKKVPKGAQEDYELDEDGELVLKPKEKRTKGKKARNNMGTEGSAESGDDNDSEVSVLEEDENGNVVKKKKKKINFKPVGPGEHEVRKATLDEYLRMEEEFEKNGPPLNKEEAQNRAMYKAMLTKAKQDPKLMNLFKNFMKEKGVNVDDENFVVDYDNFKDYIRHFKETHSKCGNGNCTHLQRFYARIGYYPNWNNRVPLEMKRPDIAADKSRGPNIAINTSPTAKLPSINPRKLGSPKI